MGSKQASIHLFHQMASLRGIHASKQSCIVVPLIQGVPTQEESTYHVLNKFSLTVHNSRLVFTILDISLDIMVPWLPIDLSFDVHAFFDIHVVDQHTAELYAQLLHLISFCQFNHASQGC